MIKNTALFQRVCLLLHHDAHGDGERPDFGKIILHSALTKSLFSAVSEQAASDVHNVLYISRNVFNSLPFSGLLLTLMSCCVRMLILPIFFNQGPPEL